MPTSSKVKKKILEAIPKETFENIYELGSGWGTLAFPIAKLFPDSNIEAFETSFFPYYFTKIIKLISFLPNLHIHRKDFFTIPLKNANIVVCYLYPGAMERLKNKLENELPMGTLVISNTFRIPGWTPETVLEVSDLYKTKIYIYRKN